MSKVTIVDKVVYGVLTFVLSLLATTFVILPLLFKTIGGVSECGFPDGAGSCTSQIITLLSWPAIIMLFTIYLYKQIMKFKISKSK